MATMVQESSPGFTMNRTRWFNLALLAIVIVVLVLGGITQPQFLTPDNFIAIVRAAALIGIAAIGMTFITLSGSFVSLSTQQTAILSAILFAMALGAGWSLVPAVLVVLVAALVLGAVQGAFVALGLNSIITTLGAGAAIFGIANVITDNRTVQARSDVADFLGTARPLGVPIQVWIFVILTAITMVVLYKTTFGRMVKLVGSNRDTARASGIRVGRIILWSFVIASVFAALCGILLVAQVGQAKVLNFQGFNIQVVAAVLVGGTAIQGGAGSTLRTALGAIVIATLENYMLQAQYEEGTRLVITGAVVGIAVIAFHWVQSRRAR